MLDPTLTIWPRDNEFRQRDVLVRDGDSSVPRLDLNK
ncbi:hypothetical protein RAS1_09740 [Phycisphaerae bacterium RAS1]|nr:hypothetical protein RAS1_09740 [Phycisphaerae bacterium RAS1]